MFDEFREDVGREALDTLADLNRLRLWRGIVYFAGAEEREWPALRKAIEAMDTEPGQTVAKLPTRIDRRTNKVVIDFPEVGRFPKASRYITLDEAKNLLLHLAASIIELEERVACAD